MTDKKANDLNNSIVSVGKVVLCLLFAFITFLFIYYGVIDKADEIEYDPVRFIESWAVVDGDGKAQEIGQSYAAEEDYKEDITISSRLPSDIKEHEYIFLNNRKDAAEIDFDDDFIYEELDKPLTKRTVPIIPLLRDEAIRTFRLWQEKDDKTEY